ncbi:MAG: prepilin peptidase [Planctomycetia bacterium]|nr:prepilin peptidase [Planctomycetia bacterium]
MIDPETSFPGCTSTVAWLVAAAAGALLGRLLTLAVARLAPPAETRGRIIDRLVEAAAIATAVGLWWWEVCMAPAPAGVTAETLIWRHAAHLVLFVLLAAAAWVDLRERVIPDAITVPGVLMGLAWIAFRPASLLPIVCLEPRSFAPPTAIPDILGLCGGLHAIPIPDWLGPRPVALGLVTALVVFCAWWFVATVPVFTSDTPFSRSPWRPLIEPRTLVAAAGTGVIVAAWFVGGDHWTGALTSLAGLAVAGGMIWLTRTGASRALGREAMGFGDVTLMAMVGTWLGWQPCVLACTLAVFIGLAHGLALKILHRESELPFGPSLCLATATVVVAWRPIWERAEPAFERPGETALVVLAVILLTAASLWIWQRWRAAD